MIENVLFFPDRHKDEEVQEAVVSSVISHFKNARVDSVFLENFPNYDNFSFRGYEGARVPVFGAEHTPHHELHVKVFEDIVAWYKVVKAMKTDDVRSRELKNFHKKISGKRMQGIIQNILVKCCDEGYERPGFVCGLAHLEEFGSFLSERGYGTRLCKDYLNVMNKRRASSVYGLESFSTSIPLLEYLKN